MAGQTSGALHLLRAKARDVPERHRSLWSAIAWSYDLLGSRRTGAVPPPGGICGWLDSRGGRGGLRRGLRLTWRRRLESLADKHLVQVSQDGAAGSRFTMLEPLREFGLAQVRQAGELHNIQARANGILPAAGRIRSFHRPHQPIPESRRLLLAEHANLRTALRWALDQHAWIRARACVLHCTTSGTATLGRPSRPSRQRSPFADGSLPPPAMSSLSAWPGILGTFSATTRPHTHYMTRCLEMDEALGHVTDRTYMVLAPGILAWALFCRGDYEQGDVYHCMALSEAEKAGDEWQQAMVLANIGRMATLRGNYDRARQILEDALRAPPASGAGVGRRPDPHQSGRAVCSLGDFDHGRRHCRRPRARSGEHATELLANAHLPSCR